MERTSGVYKQNSSNIGLMEVHIIPYKLIFEEKESDNKNPILRFVK